MSTQQTEALQCAADLEYSIARHGMQDSFTLNAYKAMKMVRTQHARITELESQLAQRFDAADMATAAAQEDVARLDFLIEQRAYVVSDPDACPGHWLHWAMPDGRTWVQGDEHPTPRAAIDAARKQGEKHD